MSIHRGVQREHLNDGVIEATVVTTDRMYTFADVNSDVDDTDAMVPEIDAHLILDGYPDDASVKNATPRFERRGGCF